MRTPRPRLSPRPGQVFVITAAGFDERLVTISLTTLREQGIMVSLVGLSSEPIAGEHGLIVQADLTLDEALSAATPRLCIVPGGHMCATALMTDPRVRALLHAVSEAGGWVALANPSYAVLREDLSTTTHLEVQGTYSAETFVTHLIQKLNQTA